MSYYWVAIEFIMTGLEIAIWFLFMANKLRIRDGFKQIHFVAGWLFVTSLLSVATYIDKFSNWKSFIALFIYFVSVYIFSVEKLRNKLFTMLLFLGAIAASDILSNYIVMAAKDSFIWDIGMYENVNRLILFSISKALLLVIIALLLRISNKRNIELPVVYWIAFLMIFGLITIASLLLMDIGFNLNNEHFNKVISIIILIMIMFYFSFYYLFDRMSRYFQELNTYNLLAYQEEVIDKYVLQKQESEMDIRILAHDLKHNLECMGKIAASDNNVEIMQLIEAYNQRLKENEMIDVGNDVANAIINQKIAVARKNGIEFEVRGCFGGDLKISKIDLISLLGNLLDNALEANYKINNGLDKKIELNVSKKGNLLMLNICNSYGAEPITRGNTFVTDKSDKKIHGIGMLSINKVVEKYSGIMTNDFEEHIFTIHIALVGYHN